MKCLLFLLLFPLSAIAQKQMMLTNTDKIKLVAVKYLKDKLNDPGSYAPVGWTDLRTEYGGFFDTERAGSLSKQESELRYSIDKINNYLSQEETKKGILEFFDKKDWPNDSLMNISKNTKLSLEKNRVSLSRIKDEENNAYVRPFKNYYIEHKFRARNAHNGLILTTYYFKFTKDLKLMDYGNIEEK